MISDIQTETRDRRFPFYILFPPPLSSRSIGEINCGVLSVSPLFLPYYHYAPIATHASPLRRQEGFMHSVGLCADRRGVQLSVFVCSLSHNADVISTGLRSALVICLFSLSPWLLSRPTAYSVMWTTGKNLCFESIIR